MLSRPIIGQQRESERQQHKQKFPDSWKRNRLFLLLDRRGTQTNNLRLRLRGNDIKVISSRPATAAQNRQRAPAPAMGPRVGGTAPSSMRRPMNGTNSSAAIKRRTQRVEEEFYASDFLNFRLAEQAPMAARSEPRSGSHERGDIAIFGRQIRRPQRLDQAQRQPAQHGARQGSDAAQHGGGEGLDPSKKAQA